MTVGTNKKVLGTIVVALMLLAGLLPFCCDSAQASIPTWEKGQKWAVAGEKDIGEVYESMENLLMDNIDSSAGGSFVSSVDVTKSEFQGNISLNLLFEVVDVTSTEYIVEVKYSGVLDLEGHYAITGKFINPGTYITYYNPYTYYDYYNSTYVPASHENYPLVEDASRTTRAMNMDLNAIAGAYGTAKITIDKSELGIKKVEAEAHSYSIGSLAVDNYPKIESVDSSDPNNFDSMSKFGYQDYDIDWNANASGTLKTLFSNPAVFVQTPAEQGDVWDVETTATNSGTYAGTVDVDGLSNEQEKMIFTDSMKDYGLTGFPINLEDFFLPGSNGKLGNGNLYATTNSIDVQMTCLREKSYNDPVLGSIEVSEIAQDSSYPTSAPLTSFYYCPENGHIVKTSTTYNQGGVGITLEAVSVPADEAAQSYEAAKKQVDTKSETVITSSDLKATQVNDLLMILLAVCAIVIVAIVAIVLMIRRKRKAAPPLPPMPPAPPMQ